MLRRFVQYVEVILVKTCAVSLRRDKFQSAKLIGVEYTQYHNIVGVEYHIVGVEHKFVGVETITVSGYKETVSGHDKRFQDMTNGLGTWTNG